MLVDHGAMYCKRVKDSVSKKADVDLCSICMENVFKVAVVELLTFMAK